MSSREAQVPVLRTVAGGVAFGESPRWHDDRLWFADWGTRELVAVDADGATEVAVQLDPAPFQPISFDWLPDGRLVVVSSRDRLLLRREGDGSLVSHADLSELSDHGLNEIVVDGRGSIYVNGADFDVTAGDDVRPGIVGLITPDGAVRKVADGVAFPNGMAVTPDNSTLIVAESYGRNLTAFDIEPDGALAHRRVWADLGDGVPDGICVDGAGAVWYGDVPNKRCVRVREGGDVLETIDLGLGCFACMLGGQDRTTLFMMVREWRGMASTTDERLTGAVLATEALVPGAGWPW